MAIVLHRKERITFKPLGEISAVKFGNIASNVTLHLHGSAGSPSLYTQDCDFPTQPAKPYKTLLQNSDIDKAHTITVNFTGGEDEDGTFRIEGEYQYPVQS